MATTFKCSMFFNGPKHGWSETHWYNDGSDDYSTAMAVLKNLADKRGACLAFPCQIIGLRVSAENPVKNDAYSIDYIVNAGFLDPQDADEPDAALLVRFPDPSFKYHKNLYMRGIPDNIDIEFGTYSPTTVAGWIPAFNLLMLTMDSQSNWGWYGKIGPTPNNALVDGYTTLPTNQVEITLKSDLFPIGTFGTRVSARVSGINTPSKSVLGNPNVWIPTTARIAVTAQPIAVLPYSHGGKMVFNQLGFIRYLLGKPRRIVTRRVGAPLLSSRGRAKAGAKG